MGEVYDATRDASVAGWSTAGYDDHAWHSAAVVPLQGTVSGEINFDNRIQQFQPRFTSHGFQYLEISGLAEPLPLAHVQAVAISSLHEVTASYESSNAAVNKLIPFVRKNLAAALERENKDDRGIKRPPYSLMTGFIGTAWISKALSDAGRSDLAYRLLQNRSYPSWLYPIEQGATTIWERLNGYTADGGFGGNNSMNSFNRYSFGAVGRWLLADSLGEHLAAAAPGVVFVRFENGRAIYELAAGHYRFESRIQGNARRLRARIAEGDSP